MPDEGTPRNAKGAKRCPDGKGKTGCHVDDVDRNVACHGRHGILHPDEPSLQRHQREGGRGCPDADEKIAPRKHGHLRRTGNERHSHTKEQPLECPDEQRRTDGNSEALNQNLTCATKIPPAKGLRRHTPRAHSQETEVPVEQIEEHGADGNAANGRGIGDMACYGNVHHAHKRHGDICQDAGYRQPQDLVMEGFHENEE